MHAQDLTGINGISQIFTGAYLPAKYAPLRKILRRIFGPTRKKDVSWKIKTNTELDKLIQHRNVINYVKAQRLSWLGHVHRKPETSIVRKIYKWQPYVTRPAGRPKHRWDDDVRNDLRRMKLLQWSEQAQDRLEWKKNCRESQDST